MKHDIISFDLQGTLSDSKFSDTFWFEVLPKLFSIKNNVSLDTAQTNLKEYFEKIGEYDFRYYSINFWMKEFSVSFKKICKMIKYEPYFYKDTLKLIKRLKKENKKLIIISSTTYDFINQELGENKKYFDFIFSSLDDFNIPGKPELLYKKIAKKLNTSPNKIIHIGDSKTMDITNAQKANYNTFYFDKKISRKQQISQLTDIL